MGVRHMRYREEDNLTHKLSDNMIENAFKKWLERELYGDYDFEDLKEILEDDDFAMDVWDNFETWHRGDVVDLVRQQAKEILKKKQPNREVIGPYA